MWAKKILVMGTSSRGGIRSVVEAYDQSCFYTNGSSVFIPTHQEGGLLGKLLRVLSAIVHVILMLVRKHVALLHLHVAYKGSFWRKAIFLAMARPFRVPVIFHLHGSEFARFFEGGSPLARKMIIRILDGASAIVVVSEFWCVYVRKITRARVLVIENFVQDRLDPALLRARRDPSAVLFLGQFGQRKGIYDLIPAFAMVRQRFPYAMLYCGGNGEIDKVRRRVHDLSLDNGVRVLGWVSGEEKQALMHQCSIFVLPSYNEGLPMAIIEAMSFSMSIVSTRVGGIPELVDNGRNGFLVNPGDQADIAAALLRMLSLGPERVAEMGRESRRRYDAHFSPESAIERMRALYVSLGVMP